MTLNDDVINERAIWDPESSLKTLLGNQRDALLVKALANIYRKHHDDDMEVAIVYGAEHTAPTIRYLAASLGYVIRDSDWLTVFTHP